MAVHSTTGADNPRRLSGISTKDEVRAWLDAFAIAVRDHDFARGREMFAGDVVGFGSVAKQVHGLDTLVDQQWRKVWPFTTGFDFDPTATIGISEDGSSAWVAAMWSSIGQDVRGQSFVRSGRVTIILERCPTTGVLLAKHTHYSLVPTTTGPTT